MDFLKNSKSHVLALYEIRKTTKEGKKGHDHKEGENLKSIEESSKERKSKKYKSKCNYCNSGYHPKSSCMKNTINIMAQNIQ
jgi:hypothetical protein